MGARAAFLPPQEKLDPWKSTCRMQEQRKAWFRNGCKHFTRLGLDREHRGVEKRIHIVQLQIDRCPGEEKVSQSTRAQERWVLWTKSELGDRQRKCPSRPGHGDERGAGLQAPQQYEKKCHYRRTVAISGDLIEGRCSVTWDAKQQQHHGTE